MHLVLLILFSLLLVGSAIKFDNAKLKAAIAEGDKDPEKIPCWNSTRWGETPVNTMKVLESPGIVECAECPCKLMQTKNSNLKICDNCDLEKTRKLANNRAESKFKAEEIANCGASSKCAEKNFMYPMTCRGCPPMLSVPALNKFMRLLDWLDSLKE